LAKSGLTINGSKVRFEIERPKSHPLKKEGKHKRTVHVNNITFEADESEIYDFFSQVGAIESIYRPKQDDGRNTGFAKIMFTTQDEAKSALEKNNKILNGRQISVRPYI
jgi:RNA recognition motif-containing protein